VIRPSALPFLVVLFAACVGSDPVINTTSPEGGGGGGGTRSINCDGMSTCNGTQLCCAVGVDWIGSTCKDACTGYELGCDDATDCGPAKVCCYTTDGGARVAKSYCKAACGGGLERQLCATGADNECAAPATCVPFVNHSPTGLARCQ